MGMLSACHWVTPSWEGTQVKFMEYWTLTPDGHGITKWLQLELRFSWHWPPWYVTMAHNASRSFTGICWMTHVCTLCKLTNITFSLIPQQYATQGTFTCTRTWVYPRWPRQHVHVYYTLSNIHVHVLTISLSFLLSPNSTLILYLKPPELRQSLISVDLKLLSHSTYVQTIQTMHAWLTDFELVLNLQWTTFQPEKDKRQFLWRAVLIQV